MARCPQLTHYPASSPSRLSNQLDTVPVATLFLKSRLHFQLTAKPHLVIPAAASPQPAGRSPDQRVVVSKDWWRVVRLPHHASQWPANYCLTLNQTLVGKQMAPQVIPQPLRWHLVRKLYVLTLHAHHYKSRHNLHLIRTRFRIEPARADKSPSHLDKSVADQFVLFEFVSACLWLLVPPLVVDRLWFEAAAVDSIVY